MTENAYALVADTASGVVNLVDTCLSGAVDPMEMVRRRENDFPFEAAKTIYDTVCEEYRRFDAERSDTMACDRACAQHAGRREKHDARNKPRCRKGRDDAPSGRGHGHIHGRRLPRELLSDARPRRRDRVRQGIRQGL